LYDVATSLLPALWLLLRSSEVGLAEGVGSFLLGYLAFISLYELGYLANDVIDARRPGGRQRCTFATPLLFLLLFAGVRIACWIAIALATGWIGNAVWLSATAAMALVFFAHNAIVAPEPRIATFLQLALLRFSLPILGIVPAGSVPLILILALLFYVHLRGMAYIDSKHLLAMPARKHPQFGQWQILLMLPIAMLIAVAAGSTLPLELWPWYALLYSGWGLLALRRA
jgi:hypothetical protein